LTRISFSVASELVNHPDKAKIVEKNPKLTAREAREKMKHYKATLPKSTLEIDQVVTQLTAWWKKTFQGQTRRSFRLATMVSRRLLAFAAGLNAPS
jgi:hypothetical protein